MTPRHIRDNDPWFLGEHIPDCDIYFFQVPASCFNSNSSYKFVKNYNKFLGVFKGFTLNFYVGEKDSIDVAESILSALVSRKNFPGDLDKNIMLWSKKLISYSLSVKKLKLQNYSNKDLWKIYRINDQIHTKLYTYGWLPVAVDIYHNNFTNYLKSYLYSVCDSKVEADAAFIVLTTPIKKTLLAKEREELLKIYSKFNYQINKKNKSKDFLNCLKRHAQKWGHLGYIYAGNVDVFTPDHYERELVDFKKNSLTPAKVLSRELRQLVTVKNKQFKLYTKLGIDIKHRTLFEASRAFALSKLYRRHAQLLNLRIMHTTLLTEISNRLGLSRYQVQFMLAHEVKDALFSRAVNKVAIRKRLKHCILYMEKNLEIIYTGAQEKKLLKQVRTKYNKKVNELLGQTAQPGYGKGKVKIILRARDMKKMNSGDVLVSVATDPDIVPAMKKASAIVTEQGGITSHAAIVSRELGIPCIIGTKIATRIFKDGDIVEVDADKGIVRKI